MGVVTFFQIVGSPLFLLPNCTSSAWLILNLFRRTQRFQQENPSFCHTSWLFSGIGVYVYVAFGLTLFSCGFSVQLRVQKTRFGV